MDGQKNMKRRKTKCSEAPIARCMPVEEWPPGDRATWEAACQQATPLDPPGRAVRWSKATRALAVMNWGRYLTFLASVDDLDPAETPGQRLTNERCTAFIQSLRQRLSPNTVDVAIVFLRHMGAALAPSQDWSWVQRHPLRPTRQEVRQARKPREVPDPVQLLGAAIEYCDAADAEVPTPEHASRFRDGALVAFTISTAVRRRNITETKLGEHLFLSDQGARLLYPDTKNGEPFDIVLGPMLTDILQRYVRRHRPVLLAGSEQETAHLWIAQRGEPMKVATIYNTFRATAYLLTTKHYSLHSARHALATEIMRDNPRSLPVAAAALGHRTKRTTRRAYDQSGSDPSNKEWSRLIKRMKRGGR